LPPTTSANAGSPLLDPDELLFAGARELGIHLGETEALAFRTYREELLRWSARMNLTALTNPVEIVRQGFLDSLACAPLFPPHTLRALDIGSGAGFPAIPIAIIKPEIEMTLIEPSRKKVTFLRHITRTLELTGVRIRPGRVETFLRDKDMLGAFDVALARAVAPLGDVGPTILPFLRPRGVFLAQVGSGEGVEEAVDRLRRIGFEMAGEAPVPGWIGKPWRRILTLRRQSTR